MILDIELVTTTVVVLFPGTAGFATFMGGFVKAGDAYEHIASMGVVLPQGCGKLCRTGESVFIDTKLIDRDVVLFEGGQFIKLPPECVSMN